MTFEEYCIKKKINSEAFQQQEPDRWMEWKQLFELMYLNSFIEQKKFLINEVRRRYKA